MSDGVFDSRYQFFLGRGYGNRGLYLARTSVGAGSVRSLVLEPSAYVRVSGVVLSSSFLSFLNNSPCSGLVRMSAIMSVVGRYTMSTSPVLILSCRKKYRTSTCRVRSLFERPLRISCMVDWLSWYTRAVEDVPGTPESSWSTALGWQHR